MSRKTSEALKHAKNLEAIAHHEAGHAVASYALGVPFRYATIRERETSLGHVRYFKLPRWFNPEISKDEAHAEMLRTSLVISLAGGIAEERVTGVYNQDGAASDRDAAMDSALRITAGDKLQEFCDEAWAETEAIIGSRWPAVVALARALMEKKTIWAGEARKIMASALPAELNEAAAETASRFRRLKRRRSAEERRDNIAERIFCVRASAKRTLTLEGLAAGVFGVQPSELKRTQIRDVLRLLREAGLVK